MSSPLFSVIIPTFGKRSFLRETVDSVLAQTVPSFECVIVSDGGPVPMDMPNDRRIRIIRRSTNGGTAAARNAGLEVAQGTFVVFLDDDDLFAPTRLESALIALDHADVVVCWDRFVDGPARPRRMLEGDVSDVLLENLVPNMGATVTRTRQALAFDERLRSCEDVEWWIRTCQRLRIETVARHEFLYRRHAHVTSGKSQLERARARARVIDWHADFFATRPRSLAFQWRRVAMHLQQAGEYKEARAVLIRSLRAHPSARTLLQFLRARSD